MCVRLVIIKVYRVRQFVTSKGAVINRGDSFKRSFKRSNQSLSSANGGKKERDTPSSGGGANLSPGPMGDQSFSNGLDATPSQLVDVGGVDETIAMVEPVQPQGAPSVRTYVVYVLGAPTVGKNALIKQFKTSEYRGTYDICAHQSTGESMEPLNKRL